jgi:hypothetical protein
MAGDAGSTGQAGPARETRPTPRNLHFLSVLNSV